MSYQELLQKKAIQVCERCASAGVPQPLYYFASEYSINFSWQHEGKKHTLALYYNTKQQSWKPVANTEWLKQVIVPVIQPLFGQHSTKATLSLTETSPAPAQEHRVRAYFANALACLSLLTPFANDNIDCSIICQRTREAVKMVLSDPTLSQPDRQALSEALEMPDTTHFFEAKEYLSQCLTLCNINNAVN